MWARGLALVALIATTVGGDRLSKQAVVRHLAHRSPRSFLADSVRLDYVENRGAFLSLGAGLPAGVPLAALTASATSIVSLPDARF